MSQTKYCCSLKVKRLPTPLILGRLRYITIDSLLSNAFFKLFEKLTLICWFDELLEWFSYIAKFVCKKLNIINVTVLQKCSVGNYQF